jgi:hypothetical protein
MEDLSMSEVFSALEVRRGRYVPHTSSNELQAQPRRYEQYARTDESQAQPLVVAINANDFSALEERIDRTVEMVKWERQGRMAAEERALHAEAALNYKVSHIEQMKTELSALRVERNEMRTRAERMLAQLDALELSYIAEPGRRPVTSILDLPATGAGTRCKSAAASG